MPARPPVPPRRPARSGALAALRRRILSGATAQSLAAHAVLLFFVLLSLFPIYLMLNASLKVTR